MLVHGNVKNVLCIARIIGMVSKAGGELIYVTGDLKIELRFNAQDGGSDT